MRVRICGDKIVDAAKPFRHADLSPREELAELRAELASLERWRLENTTWQTWPASDEPAMKKIQVLKRKIHELDFIYNDAVSPKSIATVADLNRRHAEYWEGRY